LDKVQLQPGLLRRVSQVIAPLPWGAEKTRLLSSHGAVPKEGPQKSPTGLLSLIYGPSVNWGSLPRDAQPQEISLYLSSNGTLLIHTDLKAFDECLINFLKYLRNKTFSLTIIILA